LTGEARYAEPVERTSHNALLGALLPGDIVAADFGEGLRFVRVPGEQRAVAVLRGPLHTRRFADFASLASPGIAGEAVYRAWFPQPTLDR
jgi:hypothetical protein